MLRKVLHIRFLPVACLAVAVVFLATGCPWWWGTGTAKVTTAFTTDSGSLKNVVIEAFTVGKSVVDVNDIESLTVSLDEVTLDREGTDDSSATDESTTLKDQVVIYGGSMDINLFDLQDLSQVLSTAEIPAGTYKKIRLEISNPRLVLKSDPETEITDVKLTANGHLFIDQDFTLADGDNVLLLLDFGGIHVALNGNGRYVLTPQLQADLELVSADASVDGTIADLDTVNNVFTLVLPDDAGEYTVNYVDGDTDIYLFDDPDGAPTGDDSALADGLEVHVEGLFQVDLLTIDANLIRILTDPGV